MKKIFMTVILVIALVVPTMLVACAPEAKPAPPEQKPIKIGTSQGLSGMATGMATALKYGMLQRAAEINEVGGLLGGRKVDILIEDDEAKPERATTIAARHIDVDGCCLLIAGVTTAVGLATAEVCDDREIPVICPASAGAALMVPTRPWVFGYFPATTEQAACFAVRAQKVGAKKVAIYYADNTWGHENKDAGVSLALKYGYEVVCEVPVPVGATETMALVAQMKAANPDIIMNRTYEPETAALLRAREALDWKVTVLSEDSITAGAAKLVTPDLLEDVQVNPLFLSTKPLALEALARGKERFGKEAWTSDSMFCLAYDAVTLAAKAITRAGSTDPAAIRDALETIRDFKDITCGGIDYTLSYGPDDHIGLDRDAYSWFAYK